MNSNNLVTQRLVENKKNYHPDMCSSYRKYDEQFIHTKAYMHYAGQIRRLTEDFRRPISVLDVGCGTGRYFHALRNLQGLTGIDVSPNMLAQAQDPFQRENIALQHIELIEGNFYDYDFGGVQFDFIYSVGVLGEHTVFDKHVCAKLYALLKDGGRLFFTTVDIEPRKNLKRKLAEAIYPLMAKNIKRIFDKRWETCYMNYDQLDEIMRNGEFSSFTISRYVSEDPSWKGVHLDCFATK
ncbi:MAG TPA: class I SAM-dependent methyltransferase [Flavipsychrobacter sp.]|nr:class I SAM-dependent methyltransferase [Flavipsychrobacter sp.]